MEAARDCVWDCPRRSRHVTLFFPSQQPGEVVDSFSPEETEAQRISATCPRSCHGRERDEALKTVSELCRLSADAFPLERCTTYFSERNFRGPQIQLSLGTRHRGAM